MTLAVEPSLVQKRRRAEVRARDFIAALDEYAATIRVLSLDCFDTILFRKTSTPVDVFYDLAAAPAFQKLGFNAKLRVVGERTARQLKTVKTGRTEVTLAEIYRAAFPELTDDEVRGLVDAEIAAEIATCYALPRTIELIRAAKAKGLGIIIVSDTYFEEEHLRRLLAGTLPEGVLELVDRVYVSSAYGKSKAGGLFTDVLRTSGFTAPTILHLGDNFAADARAPRALGIEALHFVHYGEPVEQLLRFQTAACNVLSPSMRSTESSPSPFRGLLASRAKEPSAEELLGYAGVGPILYGFARFVLDELEDLREKGKNPKPVFLMRDAYLPQRVCSAVAGREVGKPIAVSRFASNAASFRAAADVERFLASYASRKRYATMAKQLLLPDSMAREIVAQAERARDGAAEFARRIFEPKVLAAIFAASKSYRARLLHYLSNEVGLARGDTLVFIDLGYEGTAQRQLAPVLRDELGVDLVGRYLLVARTPGWEESRKGLIDPSWCDDRVIATLVPHIALLEDICTSDEGSVIDYDGEGRAVRGERVIGDEQYQRVKPIQASCELFAKEAEAFYRDVGRHPDPALLRVTALGALGRLLFFPTEQEISCLEGFHLDMNLGSDDAVRLFDREKGLAGLRRRGPFFMEKGERTQRMNFPVELRAAGIELATTLLTVHRYGLAFAQSDTTLRREKMRVLILRGDDATTVDLDAAATHDGYFALTIPVGGHDLGVGVMFERYTWVQIESVELIKSTALFRDNESEHTQNIRSAATFDSMTERAPGLYECLSETAFMMLAPRARRSEVETSVCRVVFRPVARRAPK